MNQQSRLAIGARAPRAVARLRAAKAELYQMALGCRDSSVFDLAELCVADTQNLMEQVAIVLSMATPVTREDAA